MKRMNSNASLIGKIALVVTVLSTMLVSAGCSALDTIGKFSITSFDSVLAVVGDNVTPDEINNGWSLQSPGGERFFWSKDFSASGKPGLMMAFSAIPFLDAGLDPDKLPEGSYSFDEASSMLMVQSEKVMDKFTNAGEPKPLDSFKKIVENHRDLIGYHAAMDHYGVSLGNGNMFEWAHDMSTNDKDIVFILNPQPFLDAGVDASIIQEWVYAKVEVMDSKGKKELIDKFLKPYDLR